MNKYDDKRYNQSLLTDLMTTVNSHLGTTQIQPQLREYVEVGTDGHKPDQYRSQDYEIKSNHFNTPPSKKNIAMSVVIWVSHQLRLLIKRWANPLRQFSARSLNTNYPTYSLNSCGDWKSCCRLHEKPREGSPVEQSLIEDKMSAYYSLYVEFNGGQSLRLCIKLW